MIKAMSSRTVRLKSTRFIACVCICVARVSFSTAKVLLLPYLSPLGRGSPSRLAESDVVSLSLGVWRLLLEVSLEQG